MNEDITTDVWNDMLAALTVGDIDRRKWPADGDPHWLNLYLGSGRCGACFDRWGLMNVDPHPNPVYGNNPTHLMHADFWDRDTNGLDGWQSLLQVKWRDHPLPAPTEFRQKLTLATGRLTTTLSSDAYRSTVSCNFDPYRRDLLGISFDFDFTNGAAFPALQLALQLGGPLTRTFEVRPGAKSNELIACLTCGSAQAELLLKCVSEHGEASLRPNKDGVSIEFEGSTGKHLLLIAVGNADRQTELVTQVDSAATTTRFFDGCAGGWRRRYGGSYVHLPEREAQALWARSLFHVLSSYGPDVRAPAPPMGWAGLAWNRNFPQDLSYIHPALLRLGHLDIARAWVEYFFECIELTTALTRRVYGVDGIFWPWNMPMRADSPLHIENTPQEFQYQLHNSAYPSRMAYETARALDDLEWSRRVAAPIIFGSATFFASILTKEPDGTWGIHVQPSSGQDELGGKNAPNYLCALFAAKYSLQTALHVALEWGLEADDRWQTILKDGLAFACLYDAELGIYSTNGAHRATEVIGKQKHPVQLFPYAFVPIAEIDDIDPPTHTAFLKRAILCESPDKPTQFWGFTLLAYILSAVRQGDAAAFRYELDRLTTTLNVDPDLIQFYESTGRWYPFFVTSSGIYLQAIQDAFVQQFGESVVVRSGIIPGWEQAKYARLVAGNTLHSSSGAR